MIDFAVDNIPQDEKPDNTYEYACEVCGVELFYSGRGRKPRFCEEHKKKGSTSTRKKVGVKNEQLAAQATELIVGITDVMQVGCILISYIETATTISDAQPRLREQVYAALLSNPARAQSIINLLGKSADAGLIVALGSFALTCGAAGFNEFRNNRDENRE
jgi:hypothetical protein